MGIILMFILSNWLWPARIWIICLVFAVKYNNKQVKRLLIPI